MINYAWKSTYHKERLRGKKENFENAHVLIEVSPGCKKASFEPDFSNLDTSQPYADQTTLFFVVELTDVGFTCQIY